MREDLRDLNGTREQELRESETVRQEKAMLAHQLDDLKSDFSYILSAMKENDVQPTEKVQVIVTFIFSYEANTTNIM